MEPEPNRLSFSSPRARVQISLDWWAVLTALALVLLILTGIIPSVSW